MGCDGSLKLKHDDKNEKMLAKKDKSNNNQDDFLTPPGVDEITLIYNILDYKVGDKIKLFGEQFVINNKDKCLIKYNKKEFKLTDYFELPEINKKGKIEIKLRGIKNITNINNMFSYNYKFLSSPDISEWNTINITDMSKAFMGCFNLSGLKGISKWNTENVENMSEIFANCEDCENLPDISKWNTNKCKNINKMFYNCIKLKYLPDISNWKTNNITEMKSLFEKCENLKSLPDI